MTKPEKCQCGSVSWERKIAENRYICASCKSPLWQPIETAPKDEWILTYQAHGQHGGTVFTGGHCYVAKWAYGNEFWYDKSSNIFEIQDMKDHATTYFTCVPTHWMPLPPPPKKGEE